jgi:hypothetical protein
MTASSDDTKLGGAKVEFVATDGSSFALWRALLVHSNDEIAVATDGEARYQLYINALRRTGNGHNNRWAIFLSHGGYFAGGMFNNGNCTLHTTFHRYTTRKKQGGSQASKDGQSGTSAPRSIGASIRREQYVKYKEVRRL